jgi:NADP-dependent 3-hydroxy acid dehydrogenase YdfG
VTSLDVQQQLKQNRDLFAMPPSAIAEAIAFAIRQPATIDVIEIIVRSTRQP